MLDFCRQLGSYINQGFVIFTENDLTHTAQDALNLALVTLEDDHAEIPKSSNPVKIKLKENEFLTMIKADTIEYRKKTDNKSVKKTLSIPQWLDTIAQRQKINFSQVLQKALMEECKIK